MDNRDFTASVVWTVSDAAKVLAQSFCLLGAAFFLVACGGSSSPAPTATPVQLDPSSDSTATDIVLSGVELDQFFQSSLFSYTASVSLLVPTTTVTVTPSHANATITVNGAAVGAAVASDKITLDQGVNTLEIAVTAEDGVNITTYTFNVTRRTAESLAQRAYIKRSSRLSTVNDYSFGWDFGASVALSRDTLAVGDLDIIVFSSMSSEVRLVGGVHLFQRDDSNVWSEQDYISGRSEGGEGFGYSVALDGDTLAIGAPMTYMPDCTMVDWNTCLSYYPDMFGRGRVHAYTRDANDVWSSLRSLSGLNEGDAFGASVALDGDTLAVGSIREGLGAVHVFTHWGQRVHIPGGNGERFGESVALDGDTLAVGHPWEDSGATGIDGDQSDNSVQDSGAVFVFTRDPCCIQSAYIKAPESERFDLFGFSIALNSDTLAVGSPGKDLHDGDDSIDEAGAVYVFSRDASGIWSQQAYITASNVEESDRFGESVALDGDTLVIGAPGEDSSAIGIDGDQFDNSAENSGAVYVFTRDANNVWSQQAYIKASNTDPADGFGYSVALESGTLAVGAPNEDSSATGVGGDQSDNTDRGPGAVYVFD